ncbi:MAG: pitrilysin family protein [Elainellaceae cyanobacterium]
MTSRLIDPVSLPRLNAPTLRRLPNGLTIIAEQMPTEAVNLSLWLNVGSAVEADSINGMAHFLEHMIFKGTNSLESGEFERLIEQRGAVTNAATSQDYTHYHITTAPKDFAALAPLQVEVVLNAAIHDEAFERERPVIIEEIRRANDSPGRRTLYRSLDLAFEQLPYRRHVLGPQEVIENLTAQQMKDFHRTWYRPRSMTAVAVGNLPVEELIDTVTQSFAQSESNPALAEPSATPWNSVESSPAPMPVSFAGPSPRWDYQHQDVAEAPFEGVTRREYVDDKLQQARLVMMWRVPGVIDMEETYALDILASVIGQGRTSRLVRGLREEQRLVSSISASNMTFAKQGIFSVSAQLPEENLEQVEAAIANHIRQLHHHPVTHQEISRVQTLVANRFIFGSETPSNRAGLYGYYQTIAGDINTAINYPSRIRTISADHLQAAAQRYLSPGDYGVVVIRPSAD